MYLSADTLITVGAVFGVVTTFFAALFSVYKWYLRQQQQDAEIASIKKEQCLMTWGILACLDGLEQLGCNHTVTETRNRIEKHINKEAHGLGGNSNEGEIRKTH